MLVLWLWLTGSGLGRDTASSFSLTTKVILNPLLRTWFDLSEESVAVPMNRSFPDQKLSRFPEIVKVLLIALESKNCWTNWIRTSILKFHYSFFLHYSRNIFLLSFKKERKNFKSYTIHIVSMLTMCYKANMKTRSFCAVQVYH